MSKDQVPLLANGSQEFGMLGYGDINNPLVMTGPTIDVPIGAFPPRDGEQIKMEAVACLAQAPAALSAYVSVGPSTVPGCVRVSAWTSAFAAAAGSTVTKFHLIATKGSAVTK